MRATTEATLREQCLIIKEVGISWGWVGVHSSLRAIKGEYEICADSISAIYSVRYNKEGRYVHSLKV